MDNSLLKTENSNENKKNQSKIAFCISKFSTFADTKSKI